MSAGKDEWDNEWDTDDSDSLPTGWSVDRYVQFTYIHVCRCYNVHVHVYTVLLSLSLEHIMHWSLSLSQTLGMEMRKPHQEG